MFTMYIYHVYGEYMLKKVSHAYLLFSNILIFLLQLEVSEWSAVKSPIKCFVCFSHWKESILGINIIFF